MIAQCLIQMSETHLSMSGDSPFVQGDLAAAIWKYGEHPNVDDILRGSLTMVLKEMDNATASSEM